jgi:xanthine dehydrogenase accessory factor
MTEWIGWLRAMAGTAPMAMVSILASEGSAPRGAGTRMIVTEDGLFGTIGGGRLEFVAIAQARAILGHAPGSWRVQDYPLGPLLGQCCGGRVRLLVEHVDPEGLGWTAAAATGGVLVSRLTPAHVERHVDARARPVPLSARGEPLRTGAAFAERIGERRLPVYLFGAGHVGQAIARHAAHLPLRLAWFDTRPEREAVEGVTVVPEDMIAGCVGDAPEEAAVVILTHDHGLDYRLTRAALDRAPLAFVGLIGSGAKRARFLSRLARDGISDEARARLTCPIGIEGIRGKEPDVIAIATLAQLLRLGNGRSPLSRACCPGSPARRAG